MRMLTFYMNRAGKNLSEERKESLEKAKTILSGIIARQKESSSEHHTRTTSHGTRAARKPSHRTVTRAKKRATRKAA
jgi:hypothetical protein